jgi:DNA-binding HxlR family transcriptional regulator
MKTPLGGDSAEWNVFEFDAPPSDENELATLTHRILGLQDSTRRDVLDALQFDRRTHSELERNLKRNPGAIHRALTHLVSDGLVLQQVNARKAPIIRHYSLTPKGTYVLDLMHRYRRAASDSPIEVKTETGTYVLYSRGSSKSSGGRREYFFAMKGQIPAKARPENMLPAKRLTVPHRKAPLLE